MLFSLSPCLEFLPELKLSSLSRESASDESFSEELFKTQPKAGVNALLEMMFDITVSCFHRFLSIFHGQILGLAEGTAATPFSVIV